MTARIRGRRAGGKAALATLWALLALVALAATPAAPAAAAAARIIHQEATASRPEQSVAYARIAVVRVLSYYYGRTSGSAPIPVLMPCASDGVLIGTTGNGLNGYNYVLTASAAVNPILPCKGVQAAFQQLNGTGSAWGLVRIQVLLNAAYTGTDDARRGAIVYTIDPAQITTNGGARLVALPLSNGAGAPGHDLPVVSLPQPSDAPASGATYVLDLTKQSGRLLGSDALSPTEVNDALYPVEIAGDRMPHATPPRGGKAQQTATTGPAAPAATPSAESQSVAAGAPEIDSNGRLVGMVAPDATGMRIVLGTNEVKQAIGAISGKSGPLMSSWKTGLDAFYAAQPNFSDAEGAFNSLKQRYPDFLGVEPFLSAAQAQTTGIPSLTTGSAAPPAAPTATPGASDSPSLRTIIIIGGSALIGLLVLVLLLVLILRMRRGPEGAAAHAQETYDEPGLDLLPPDIAERLARTVPERDQPLEMPAIPAAQQHAAGPSQGPSGQMRPTVSQPPANAITNAIENVPTMKMPTAGPTAGPTASPAPTGGPAATGTGRPARHATSQPRKNTSLMAYAAGQTDPGIKRANEPNQDNMLALHGVRVAGSRPQTYGLFIVADGMGGHLNGQEASRLAIEIVTRVVLQTLNTSQTLDDATCTRLLQDGIRQANTTLRERNSAEHGDMGTTMTAALSVDDRAYVVNVGDSRTYLMSPDAGLRQITADHSVVASLVSAGVIRPEDIYTHPRRNQIYRSLGGEEANVEVDAFQMDLQAGDKLLLCSDGLWEMVRDPQIANILRTTADPRQAAQLLVREANANGGEDNISALVVRLVDDLPSNAQPGMRVLVAPQGTEQPNNAQVPPAR